MPAYFLPSRPAMRPTSGALAAIGLVMMLFAAPNLTPRLAPGLASSAQAQETSSVAQACQALIANPDAVMLDLLANDAAQLDSRLTAGDRDLACVLQHLISQRGYPLLIDGDFGPQSRRALASFKAVHCNDADPNERLDRAALSCLIDDSKPLPFALAGGLPETRPETPPTTSLLSAPDPQPAQNPTTDITAPQTAASQAPGSSPAAAPLPGPKPALLVSSNDGANVTHLRRSSQVTGQPCRDPAASSDRDITGNLALFAASPLCYSVVTVEEAGRRWLVQVIENYENVSGPAWLAPHDNEDAAQSAGIWAVAKYGGLLITFETGNQRIFQGQDANRMFGTTAQDAATCPQLRAPHPKLTALVDAYFRAAPRPYLALHSNDNGYSGNGGAGTISVLRRSSVLQGHPAKTSGGQLADDEDNLIMTAGTLGFENDPKALHFTSAMTHQGINVIYEAVSPAKNDCSFSNFVKLNRQADYYNIEVEHGNTQRMQGLIAALLSYLRLG